MNSGRNLIVVDLDGTLCNSAHREHLARERDWEGFHALLGEDEPWPDVAHFIQDLGRIGYQLIGLTGRNERWRILTEKWLLKNDICLDAILMRPDGNFESDAVIKPKLLSQFADEFLAAPAEAAVMLILEDRDKMVAAWRDLGFTCWQVRPGGY